MSLYNSSAIKVGFEGSTLFSKGYTGIPFYIQKLIENFEENSSVSPHIFFPINRYFKKKYLAPFTYNYPTHWYWNSINLNSIDIIHCTHAPFLNLKGVQKIATIHDLAFMVDELKGIEIASAYFVKKRIKLFNQISKHADAIISVSQKTKEDFLRFFDFPEHKIHVIHLAPIVKTLSFSTTNIYAKTPYLLSVGGVSTRKNTLNMVKGFLKSNASENHSLLVVGKNGLGNEEVFKYLQKNDHYQKVILLGYVNNLQLQSLYKHASGFVFPTLYEGFGMPLLEAMNNHLPIVTSTLGAAPEVTNGHAALVNPFDIDEIAGGIDTLTQKNKNELDNAFQYAQSFQWSKNIKETIAVYASLIEG